MASFSESAGEDALTQYIRDVQRRKALQQQREDRSRFWTFPPHAEAAAATAPHTSRLGTKSPHSSRQHPLTTVVRIVGKQPASAPMVAASAPATAATAAAASAASSPSHRSVLPMQPHSSRPRVASRGVWVADCATQTTTDAATQTGIGAPQQEDGVVLATTPPRSPRALSVRAVENLLRTEGSAGRPHRRSTSDSTVEAQAADPLLAQPHAIAASPKQASSSQLACCSSSVPVHVRSRSDSSPKGYRHAHAHHQHQPSAGRSPLAGLSPRASPRLPRVVPGAASASSSASASALQSPPLLAIPSSVWNGSAVQASLDEIEEELNKITQRARDIGRELASTRRGITTSSPATWGFRPAVRVSAYAPDPARMMFGFDDDFDDGDGDSVEDDVVYADEFEPAVPRMAYPTRQTSDGESSSSTEALTSPDQEKYVPIAASSTRRGFSAFRYGRGNFA